MDYVSGEAERAGLGAAAYLAGRAGRGTSVAVRPGFGVRYVLPQHVHTDAQEDVSLFLRVTQPFGAVRYTVKSGDTVLAAARRFRAAPGEMEKLTVKAELLHTVTQDITVSLEVEA